MEKTLSLWCRTNKYHTMRIKVFIVCNIFVLQATIAHDNYHSLVEEGKTWNMQYQHMSGLYPNYDYRYYIEGDTLIADRNCKKLYVFNESNDGLTEYKMALHESDGKVCFIPNGSTESHILYDFKIPEGNSAVVSDPIHPEWEIELRNNENRLVETNGVGRHCLLVNRVDESFENYPSGWWIEGIGSELGPLNT